MAFYSALRGAGVAQELSDPLIEVLMDMVGPKAEAARRLDLLELYYAAGSDIDASRRRSKTDRMLVHHTGLRENAHAVVVRLALANPELLGVRLERFGGDDGPLVLRAGERVSAVNEDDGEEGEPGSLAVRSLVQAFNVLLARADVGARLVLLPGDGQREMYVGVGREEALALCRAGFLDEDDPERVLEFCSH